MSKFEKKFGKYAIKNLSLMLIMCYAVGYLIQLVAGDFLGFLTLNPYQILHGQIWRIVTWILIPPSSFSIFTVIMLYFYYSVGTTLERTWGAYRYNVYLFSGMLFTVLGSFVAMGLCYVFYGDALAHPDAALYTFASYSRLFSTYYINMSILLAFSATFPDAQVMLMFVFPVKMKVLGIIYGVMLVFDLFQNVGSPLAGIFYRTAIVASLLNFVIFWLTSRGHIQMSPKEIKRRKEFKHEIRKNTKMSGHKCAICGRTDADDPTLEFRYCSKCDGNYEYCQNHIFTHEHVKNPNSGNRM
ncbi:MAG: hypothetical protein NC543_02505 [bacterium]|nr:hypothetical protein [bacterium]MCM1374233.1 hypothetical protein [Muribaculum sp.]